MSNTHSELISNIKRLIAKIKALPLHEHPDFHAVSQAVKEGKDPHSHLALADIAEDQGIANDPIPHPDPSRKDTVGSYIRQSPKHALAWLAHREDPEHTIHPDVQHAAQEADEALSSFFHERYGYGEGERGPNYEAANHHRQRTRDQLHDTLEIHNHPWREYAFDYISLPAALARPRAFKRHDMIQNPGGGTARVTKVDGDQISYVATSGNAQETDEQTRPASEIQHRALASIQGRENQGQFP